MPTRRHALMMLPALALTACAAPRAIEAGTAGARAASPVDGTAPADDAAAANAVATAPAQSPGAPHGAAIARPSAAEMVERFGGRRPRGWGLDLAGVVTRTGSGSVALTFDACGGPGGSSIDQRLLAALRKNKVPATLFLNARWIAANPGLSGELAADPLFELADHGTAHRPLSVTGRAAYGIPGTASVAAAYDELVSNRQHLELLVAQPSPWYRPGTAYYDDVAVDLVRALGLVPVNFAVNGDGGATFTPTQVVDAVGAARPGDIVISHLNRPASGTAAGYEAVLPRMLDRGVAFATLSRAGAAHV
ncbi:polysaccharide deacetylase [Sinomonas cellulolyticus]|uniref:Polysaccharide deacetylase family protein n=1 Tax=Sinomonas cellulolyticus TaxID=2801916 RepID=A0ABS1K1M8_9MICC|nr:MULTISPECIES: polysaccharide deacetylase family protein [Sinomonas]MBL0705383.1 polysaccharide deacetylase family protein [Sinomonas cellulolyticus]GHG40865.1 polysaccharide deacetylase [Sinomonas sp. KCTC 49339]